MKNRVVVSVMALGCLSAISCGAGSTIQFKFGAFEANEADRIARLTVTCTPAPMAPITADLVRIRGTAQKSDFQFGTDWWEPGLGVGFWGPGQSETTVEIYLADDGIPEPDETLEFGLVRITGDAVAGKLTNATLTIHNGHPRIATDLLPWTYEDVLQCNLYRRGDTNVSMSVDYATADGTAIAGVDYVTSTGTVTFAAGQISARISITALDNGRVDGDREFRILLSNPSPGVSLLSTQVTVRIADNEAPVIWDRNFDAGAAPPPLFAVTADGKAMVHWYSAEEDDYRIVRLNSDGSRDPSFAPAFASPFNAQNVVLDSEGRCLVLGLFRSVNNKPRPGLARLTSDGALDDSFKPPSSLAVDLGSPRIAIQPDGRLLFLNFVNETKLVRLNTDGSLDSTFHPAAEIADSRHIVVTANTQAVTSVGSNLIITNGELSYPRTNQPLVRLQSNGNLDATFHRAKFVIHPNQHLEINDLAQQLDGKLLVAGQFQSVDGYPRASLVRLNADGTVDTSFAPSPGAELDGSPGRVLSIHADSQSRVILFGEFNRLNGRTAPSDPVSGQAGLWQVARLHRADASKSCDLGQIVDQASLMGWRTVAAIAIDRQGDFLWVETGDATFIVRLVHSTAQLDGLLSRPSRSANTSDPSARIDRNPSDRGLHAVVRRRRLQ